MRLSGKNARSERNRSSWRRKSRDVWSARTSHRPSGSELPGEGATERGARENGVAGMFLCGAKAP